MTSTTRFGETDSAVCYVRHEIRCYAKKCLGGNLTAYQWLLLQLYPIHYFGGDVFADAFNSFIDIAKDQMRRLFRAAKIEWQVIVVDEAQVLLKDKRCLFLSDCGKHRRSSFREC